MNLCTYLLRNEIPFPKTALGIYRFIQFHRFNNSLLTKINSRELTEIAYINTTGLTNYGTYGAKWRQQPVFLKQSQVPEEAIQLAYLNKIGLGVHLYGITFLHDRFALVMDFVPGINIKDHRKKRLPVGFKITKAHIREMRRQIDVLFQAGFVMDDPQFMISPNKVTLIDVADMKISQLIHNPHSKYTLEDAYRWLNEVLEPWVERGVIEVSSLE